MTLEMPFDAVVDCPPMTRRELPDLQFHTLALAHMDTLHRIAVRLAGDLTTAEDLVQETYLRAFRARRDFELHPYGIRPWLVRILKNVHLTHIERERHRPKCVGDQYPEPEAMPSESRELSSADPRLFDAISQRLARALTDLPQHYQSVLLLWAVDELSYDEIAAALHIPVGTVMSRLHRARTRLAERLGGVSC